MAAVWKKEACMPPAADLRGGVMTVQAVLTEPCISFAAGAFMLNAVDNPEGLVMADSIFTCALASADARAVVCRI
jgi:hypothetical protein